MNLVKSIATVGNYTILSRIVGFFRDKLMAMYIGPGPVMDALSVAIKIPSFFRRLFAEGAFNAAFIPLFSSVLTNGGKKEARTYAEEIMAWLITLIIIVIVIFEIFMPTIMQYLAYGFRSTPDRMELAITLTRITMPYLLLISLTALYGGILNSLDKFVSAASSPAAGNTFLVLAIFTCRHSIAEGASIAWIILISGTIQLLWVLIPASKEGLSLRPLLPRITPQVKTFFKKMIPGAIGSGVVQINLFIGTLIASFLPVGGISYLYFADRLNQLPLSVIGTAVSTALLPLMSRQIKEGNISGALHNQNRSLEYALLLVLPASIALFIAALPFVRIVFEGDKFGINESLQTARTLQAFSFGLPAYILIKIFSTTFFARKEMKTPVVVASFCVIVDIILSILLLKPLAYVGIALATAASAWINAIVLGVILKKQNFLKFDKKIRHFFPRCLLAAIIMGVAVFYTSLLVEPFLCTSIFWKFLIFCFLVGVGLVVFFGTIFLSKAVDFKEMWKKTF